MLRFRRLVPVIAALVAIALVASPADAKKKKKKKPPVAQQGIAGSVTLVFQVPGTTVTGVDREFFEFDWTSPNNARAAIEATFAPGLGLGDPLGYTNNDVDIALFADDAGAPGDQVAGNCDDPQSEPTGDGCSFSNGSELLDLPKQPLGKYHVEFHLFAATTLNLEVEFVITFFNAAGKPGPAPAPA